MSYAHRRRHYRVAQKEVEQSPRQKGLFIPKRDKCLYYALFASFAVIIFLKGIVIGFIIGRNYE